MHAVSVSHSARVRAIDDEPEALAAPTRGSMLLLPAPDPVGLAGLEDGLSALYAMQNEQMMQACRGAELDVAAREKQIAEQRALEKAATERQAAAMRKSHGFWASLKKVASTVAKIAVVVAGAAAVVASGGAALPLAVGIAGVALSAGGAAVSELKLLGKDSEKIGMGLEIAGAVVGLGGSAAAALGVRALVGTGSTVVKTIGTAAQVTNAAGTGASAAATIAIADYERDAGHAGADVQAAVFAIERGRRETKAIIESSEEGMAASRDALAATRGAIEATGRAADAAIAGVKG
jgi:hypothetical protein